MQFRAVKGMNDILPPDVARWHRLETEFTRAARLHGYEEVRTPLLEVTQLFKRTVGEATDIVQKEMYTFERGSESFSLRPEGTASAARAYVQHSVQAREPVTRWYYLGPMFRAERPQRGRYRQFFQAGCEVYGDPGPACDAEMIDMLYALFVRLGIGPLEVRINSLGDAASRARYRDTLVEFLRPLASSLSETSRQRFETNPLRVLDSKAPQDMEIVANAPSVLEVLGAEDSAHFEELSRYLDALGVPYTVDPGLVRGLDYYTRTLFEIRSDAGGLGAQNTLVGGGRYDDMVRSFGGPQVPAIGFAMGLERILLAMGEEPVPPVPHCFIAPIGERATAVALTLARDVRALGQRAEVDGRGKSVKSMMRRADGSGARFSVVLGETEVSDGQVVIKDLRDRERPAETVALGGAAERIAARLAEASRREESA